MGRTERNGKVGSLRIAGRYRLVEKLGAGGMSVVWRGYDEVLGRPVAVKVLSPRLARDQAFRDRLRQEALAAARLVHPHITGIFDFGESPLSEDLTVPFVVMEFNDGESVAARIGRQGSLDWREAVTITAEVASALATAHARGLVHRDVTPANVMLTGAGAKVVDFGISAAVGQRDAAPDGSLLGTPAYLAPERLGGAQVSAATDVYALGLLLYRGLTGRLPWPAETTTEALRAHLYAAPEPVPDQPDQPAAVGELCLRCLAKRPEDRPGAAEVARSLAALVGLQPIIPPLTAREPSPLPARGAASPVPAARPATPRGLGRAALAYLGLPGGTAPRRPPVPGRRLRAALGYLGLPGGTPAPRPPAPVRRLRVALKVGTALGLGGVRPLGGGVFAARWSPRAARGLLRSALSPRHRVQAVLIALTVLALSGLTWSVSRDTHAVEQAQAAGATPAGGVPQGTVCAVRYQVKRDSGSDYEARLTVATTDAVAGLWRVQFAYPGSQRLTGRERAVVQAGRRVTVRGHGRLRAFTLRGDYRGVNALPFSFTLDGHRCRAEVLGSVTAGGPADDPEGISEAAGAQKHNGPRGQNAGGAASSGPGSRQPGRTRVPASPPAPVPSALPAMPPSPSFRRAGTRSLAF